MATDWSSLAARFRKEHARTGISVKDFCKIHSLNLASARRHIKPVSKSKSVHTKNGDARKPKNKKSTQNRSEHKTEDLNDQSVSGSEKGSDSQTDSQKNAQNRKLVTPFVAGNQCARTLGHYSEFVTTASDAARYQSSQTASLRDELHLTRMQHSNLLAGIQRLERLLEDEYTDVETKARLYEGHIRYQIESGRRVARIESIENSLVSQEAQSVNIEKNRALTRKATLEGDKLEQDAGNTKSPFNDMYEEILALGSDGMMNY